MLKKIDVILALILVIVLTGCNANNKEVIKQNDEDNKIKCSINKTNRKYDFYFLINESIVCPQMKDIISSGKSSSGNGYFITNDGELYEYSSKKYSTTNNNCKKVETDILFDKIVNTALISRDGNMYSFYESNLNKITDDAIQKGIVLYGISQTDIKLYGINNKIFYLTQLLNLDIPDIYGYVDENNIYSITYDYKSNKTNEKLIHTFKDKEKVEKVSNGFVTTNKAYYAYGIINEKECSKYEDIKCEYGLVLIDTLENCSNEIYYLSDNLIVTKEMIK